MYQKAAAIFFIMETSARKFKLNNMLPLLRGESTPSNRLKKIFCDQFVELICAYVVEVKPY